MELSVHGVEREYQCVYHRKLRSDCCTYESRIRCTAYCFTVLLLLSPSASILSARCICALSIGGGVAAFVVAVVYYYHSGQKHNPRLVELSQHDLSCQLQQ